jgi:hypothetical protein
MGNDFPQRLSTQMPMRVVSISDELLDTDCIADFLTIGVAPVSAGRSG